jgi:hypothetical protein
VGELYDKYTALITCLLFPFINQFMGCGNILLATSFYFSLPFMLYGLYVFIKHKSNNYKNILSAFLWGVAFLISPVYVFAIAALFIYLLAIRKAYKASLLMAIAFLITIIPFLIQAYSIYSQDLYQTATFALWRGIPNLHWLKNLFVDFMAPHEGTLLNPGSIIHMIILSFFGISVYYTRRWNWIITILLISYLLTYHHFSMQYAIRIQLMLSIFVVAFVIKYVSSLKIKKTIILFPVIILLGYSIYVHYSKTFANYNNWKAGKVAYDLVGENLWKNINDYLPRGDFIFCSKTTYFRFIMTYCNVYALGAHRTLDYYQLDYRISDSLEKDYQAVMRSIDLNTIHRIYNKYNIKAAVVAGNESDVPLFKTLADHWITAYQDRFFSIYVKPNSD